MSAPLIALFAALLLHAIALTLAIGDGSHAAILLIAEGLALVALVLSWPPPPGPQPTGCTCGLRRAAAQLVVAAAVALEVGRLPAPARTALVSAITAYTRIAA